MKNVWEALDKEYAQEEEVIIAVNEELKKSYLFNVHRF
jgi:hypothetical protein